MSPMHFDDHTGTTNKSNICDIISPSASMIVKDKVSSSSPEKKDPKMASAKVFSTKSNSAGFDTSSADTNKTSNFNTSNNVYVKDETYGWIPARVITEQDSTNKASVVIPTYKDEQSIVCDGGKSSTGKLENRIIDLSTYENNSLPLQNVNENAHLKEVEDMVNLAFLHEAAILYNLKARHISGKPYTRTGDIVIAVNPYKWMMDLYSDEKRTLYANTLVFNNDKEEGGNEEDKAEADPRSTIAPHVYETSSLSYKGLAVDGIDQSILVSGESGAGKTETVKILMSHIASIQEHGEVSVAAADASSANNNNVIVQRVLDSNPLLEAFGNAKTVRNDNSSRFGKYIQLQFDNNERDEFNSNKSVPPCKLIGSKCEVYLLEKSRVVGHEYNERTYHIFYQLVNTTEENKLQVWDGLSKTTNESFAYVGYTDTNTIEGKTDKERYQLTVDALSLVGIVDDKLRTLMRSICIVLQLGNLIFETDTNDEEKSTITSKDELNKLADLMGIDDQDVLKESLTYRTVTARNETYKVPLKSIQAKDTCDAFAKEIYNKTFLWLVRTINEATCAEHNFPLPNHKEYGIIGLLDIFGFEFFEVNRFEQLCINYTNEKIQQKFTNDIFRSVQQEYEYEGIELEEITYEDNVDVLDLVEGRMGLINILNEECVRPKGNDLSYVSKVKSILDDNDCLISNKNFPPNEFGIKHYAGSVIYDSTNFVTKNMDTLPSDLVQIAKVCTNGIIRKEFGTTPNIGNSSTPTSPRHQNSRRGGTPSPFKRTGSLVQETVWSKFKTQLNVLMANLSETRSRYIRCIKPNTLKKPKLMHHISTIEQLRCAGVVAAVTISRSAFPNRLEHDVILDRFKSLSSCNNNNNGAAAIANGQEQIGNADIDGNDETAMTNGNEHKRLKVDTLLTPALRSLETLRQSDKVIVKAFVIGKTRTYFRAGVLEYLESERLKGFGTWSIAIQRIARGFIYRNRYKQLYKSIVKVQSIVRSYQVRKVYKAKRQASITLQCLVRCIVSKKKLMRLRTDYNITLLQTRWRIYVAVRYLAKYKTASTTIQCYGRMYIQKQRYKIMLQEKDENVKLQNQLDALQKQLEEAENKRIDAEKIAREEAAKPPPAPVIAAASLVSSSSSVEQQRSIADEKLVEDMKRELSSLREENSQLSGENSQLRKDNLELKEDNERLLSLVERQKDELDRQELEHSTLLLSVNEKDDDSELTPAANERSIIATTPGDSFAYDGEEEKTDMDGKKYPSPTPNAQMEVKFSFGLLSKEDSELSASELDNYMIAVAEIVTNSLQGTEIAAKNENVQPYVRKIEKDVSYDQIKGGSSQRSPSRKKLLKRLSTRKNQKQKHQDEEDMGANTRYIVHVHVPVYLLHRSDAIKVGKPIHNALKMAVGDGSFIAMANMF